MGIHQPFSFFIIYYVLLSGMDFCVYLLFIALLFANALYCLS
jgi:hypothetical protein